ncbi:MAG: hypothetical protein L0H31_15115, partial [Nocardioidaceae bacterium]|nr:hypothetical protein [Nocardioidaceae bacterium]
MTSTTPLGSVVALSVHGPAGVVDLTVPIGVTVADVAASYADEAGLAQPLGLMTRTGQALSPGTEIGNTGLVSGSILIALDPQARVAATRDGAGRAHDAPRLTPGTASTTWLMLAVGVAVAAGWAASRLPMHERWPAVAVLVATAVLGCLPVGALAASRVLAAPAFAAAACFAVVWDPAQERMPAVFGFAALAAAVTAALGRALADPETDAGDGLRIWMGVGAGWFAVASLGALTSASPQTVWVVLYLAAVLGARFVPEAAIDVPDQYLLDLERLAVTAWSARERPSGRRPRIVVPEQAVTSVAARGTRMIRASTVAIFVVVIVAAPLLLWTADLQFDRVGARCLIGFGGAALLLAARSYRHPLARRMLRLAGVVSLALVAAVVLGVAPAALGGGGDGPRSLVATVS